MLRHCFSDGLYYIGMMKPGGFHTGSITSGTRFLFSSTLGTDSWFSQTVYNHCSYHVQRLANLSEGKSVLAQAASFHSANLRGAIQLDAARFTARPLPRLRCIQMATCTERLTAVVSTCPTATPPLLGLTGTGEPLGTSWNIACRCFRQ